MINSFSRIILFSAALFSFSLSAQNVGINATGAAPDAGALLDISSTNKGLLIPRVNIANLATIAPVTGSATTSMLVYNTNATTGLGFHYWDGAQWVKFFTGDAWTLTGNAGTVAGTNFLGTTDNVDFSIRRNNIETMRTLATTTSFMDEIQTRDGGANSGDILFRAYDSGDDGIVEIYEDNAYSIRLHGNGTTIFNEQAIATNDFRIESAGQANMFFVDASTNRIGIKIAPANVFDLEENAAIGATDAMQSEINGATGGALDAVSTNAANGYNAFEAVASGTGGAIFAIHSSAANNSIAARGQTAAFNDFYGYYTGDNIVALGYFTISDGDLKTNFNPIVSAIDKIKLLSPVTYNFKEDNEIGANSTKLHYGFTAQNVYSVIPDLVEQNSVVAQKDLGADVDMSNADFKYSSVNYQGIIPLLTQAIKEQQELIEAQNKKIEELEELIKNK